MIWAFNGWVLFTLGLFYLGPVPWDGRSSWLVALIVIASMAFFTAGARLGRRMMPLAPLPALLPGGAAGQYALVGLWILLSAVQVWSVTGLNLFNPFDYSFDFGAVYSRFQEASLERQAAGRTFLVTLAILLKSVIFVPVLLILVGEFRRRPLLGLAILFPLIGSSMMRGTDKEMVDVVIFVAILTFHHGMLTRRIVWLLALVPVMLVFFLERKVGRFSGFLPRCLPHSVVCFDFESWLATTVSPSAEIIYVFLTSYISQGYEGMARALDLPFEFNWGIGHLPLVKLQLCNTLSVGCSLGDFQARLTEAGWDTRHRWASVYTVLANDLHWVLVPAYFGGMGLLFGVSERSWRERGDRFSLAVVLLVSIFIIYSSANMQLAITLDWVLATLVLLGGQSLRLVFQSQRARLAAAPA